jgi:hypothetical protein
MDNSTVEISRALDIIAEDVSSCNADDNETFLIKYPDDSKVKKTSIKLMEAVKETWQRRTKFDRELFNRVRKTLKFGSTFYYKNKDGSLKELATEKMVGYILDPEDEDVVTHYVYDKSLPLLHDMNKKTQTRDLSQRNQEDNIVPIPVSDLVVFKFGDTPFGESVLEKVFKVWRQMTLLEDSVIVYRVIRAPERRIYYIDVGNLQGPKREAAIEKQRMRLMQKQATRKAGEVTTEFDPHSAGEDIFIPTNSTGKGSRVETLPGGQNLGEISDLSFFTRKLAAGLRIPPSMIDTHSEENNSFSDMRVGQMYQIEMRYMGYVKRFSEIVSMVLDENFKEFCRLRDIVIPMDAWLEVAPSMSFALYKDIELNQQMLNVYNSTMQIGAMSRRYALQKYMNFTHDELEDNELSKLHEFGLSDETIEKMLPEHIQNAVYGDGRSLAEYGVKVDPQAGGGFGGF